MVLFISKIRLKINNRSIVIASLLILLYFIIWYFYRTFTSRDYAYLGFQYYPEIKRALFSFFTFVFFIILSFIVYRNGEFYYSVYILVLLLFFLPAAIIFPCMKLPYKLFILYIILQTLLFCFSFIKFRFKELNINEKQEKNLLFIILLIFGMPFLLNIPNYDINLNVLIFKDIYETRSDFSSHSSTLVNYSYFWLIKILAPMLFIYGLIQKKYSYSVISFFILTFIYLVSGHKTVYFALALLLIFYKLKDTFVKKTILLLITVFISALIIVPLLDLVFSTRMFKFMLFERIFFDQALLTYYYFDFFHQNPIFFSESMFFDYIFAYPYDLPSANLIAWEYFHTKFQHANTGIIGDAYMNLGITGVVIITSLFSMIISFFNSLKIDERYFGLFVMYLFDFQNSSFLSILFSGGLFFLLVFALTVMRKKIIYEI